MSPVNFVGNRLFSNYHLYCPIMECNEVIEENFFVMLYVRCVSVPTCGVATSVMTFSYTVETAYKVAICPIGNLLYMGIYLITDLKLL